MSRRRLRRRAALLGPRVHLRRKRWPESTLLQRRAQGAHLAAGARPALEARQAHVALLRAQTASVSAPRGCPTFWSPRDRNGRAAVAFESYVVRCTVRPSARATLPRITTDNGRPDGRHVAHCKLRVLPLRVGAWAAGCCARVAGAGHHAARGSATRAARLRRAAERPARRGVTAGSAGAPAALSRRRQPACADHRTQRHVTASPRARVGRAPSAVVAAAATKQNMREVRRRQQLRLRRGAALG